MKAFSDHVRALYLHHFVSAAIIRPCGCFNHLSRCCCIWCFQLNTHDELNRSESREDSRSTIMRRTNNFFDACPMKKQFLSHSSSEQTNSFYLTLLTFICFNERVGYVHLFSMNVPLVTDIFRLHVEICENASSEWRCGFH